MSLIKRISQEFEVGGLKGMSIKILKRITLPISQVFYWAFNCLPIDKNIIFFRTEIDFWDNGWAFYQFLINTPKANKFKYIWLVDTPSEFSNSERTKFVSYGPVGIHILAYYYIAKARYIFFTHGMGLVPLKKRKDQVVINLCHGCGIKSGKGVAKRIRANFDFAIVTSHFFVESQAIFLHCDKQLILPLGFPRNDLLLHNIDLGQNNPFIKEIQFRKVILWMPTFRAAKLLKLSELSSDNATGLPLLDDDIKVQKFNDFLKDRQTVVLLKIHYLQADKDIFNRKFTNIIFLKDGDFVSKGLQLYQVIGKTDALLTDYSSITTDYLLTDKPMGFILDDIDNYIKDRGFVFDNVTSIMPGEHIYTIDQLYGFVNDVVNDIDPHKKWRADIKAKMFDNADDKSSERIANYFGMLK